MNEWFLPIGRLASGRVYAFINIFMAYWLNVQRIVFPPQIGKGIDLQCQHIYAEELE